MTLWHISCFQFKQDRPGFLWWILHSGYCESLCFHFIQLPLCFCWKLQSYFWCFVKQLPPGLSEVQHNFIDWTLWTGCKIELVHVRTRVKTPRSRSTQGTATVGDGPERVVGVLLTLISLSDFYFRFKLFFFFRNVVCGFSPAPVQCSAAKIKCAALRLRLEGGENWFHLKIKARE